LKPDVSTSRRRSVCFDGICALFRRTGCAQILLPCENDQAKLDPFSRLACSTNLSKILARVRLSGLVGSRPRLSSGCPRTCLRSPVYAISCTYRRFCANLSNISNFVLNVNPLFSQPEKKGDKDRSAQNI